MYLKELGENIVGIGADVAEQVAERPAAALLLVMGAIGDAVSGIVFGPAHKQGLRRTWLDGLSQRK